MKAPERLYLSKIIYSTFLYQVPDPDDETAVEYTSTDTFIKKACEWIKEKWDYNYTMPIIIDSVIDEFKKFMKGE